MSGSPIISIVIPTYNRAADLTRALQSVVAQTYTDWEAIIVDNHSTDETAAAVAAFADARFRLFRIHNHGIIAASRNLGIREARGAVIAFLDSDDWWEPTKLARAMREMDRGADLVYHDLSFVGPGRSWRRRRLPSWQVQAPVKRDLLARGNPLANSSVTVRRHLIDAIGGISELPALVTWEDFDCWLRIADRTDRFVRIAEPLGFYWIGNSNTSSPDRLIRNFEELKRRYFADREGALPAWFHLAMGRALLQLSRGRDAVPHLRLVVRGPASLTQRTKAWISLCDAILMRGRPDV